MKFLNEFRSHVRTVFAPGCKRLVELKFFLPTCLQDLNHMTTIIQSRVRVHFPNPSCPITSHLSILMN